MPDALVGWTQFPDIMIKPTQICLIAAILSGGLAWGTPDQAAAGDADTALKPRAYLFRGFAGMIFSRGTDDLADRIEKAGFEATVNEAVVCPQIAKDAIAEYRLNPALIVLIGHSMGGACAISFAEMLQAEHIPVSLLVTTEPNRIAHKVPLNVQRYIDIYQSNSLLGGFDAVPAPGFRGHVATFDLVKHDEISHVNMEKNGEIQDQVMNKILELADTPAKVEGQSLPIHYVVPADFSNRPLGQRQAGYGAFRRLIGNARSCLSRSALGADPGQSFAGRNTDRDRHANRRAAPPRSPRDPDKHEDLGQEARRPTLTSHTLTSSLRAKRSNPGAESPLWIASLRSSQRRR